MGELEKRILEDPRRGMDRIQDLLSADFCTQAGQFVLTWPRGRVLLVTGFYVDGQGEPDGPPGTRLLCDALSRLGCAPLVVPDPFCAAYVTAAGLPFGTCGPEAGEGELLSLLEREQPVGLIAVERCGRAADGRYIRSEERRVGKESRSRWSPYH